MTTAAARAGVPLRAPVRPEPRRASPLRLVPKRRSSAARTPFVVVVVVLLITGLLGLLLLNMVVAQGSFQLHALSKDGKALDQREQELSNRVQAMQAPGVLAQHATALGMVPGGPPAFLQLPSGKVLGQPTAGVAPVAPAATKPATATTGTAGTTPTRSTTTTAATKPAHKQPAHKPTPRASAPATGTTP